MATANYVLLERIELNASAASVVFSNIPQSGYTDLLIKVSSRQTNASIGLKMAINGSSGFAGKVIEGAGSGTPTSYTMTTQYLAGYNDSSAYTANTFGNTEIYIPNYLSSTNKSVTADSVTETNGTTVYMALFADLYTTTSPITTITFTADNSGSIDTYSTFSLYGLAAVGTTPAIAPKASGGNITTDGTYWIHTFNSTDVFIPQTSLSCDYLVIAGGAGGAYNAGGGGGAGGLRSTVGATGGGGSLESKITAASGTAYTVTVGAGGAGGISSAVYGVDGSNSTFSTITSIGGGGAGGLGRAGGSGGGSGYYNGDTNIPGGSCTTNQGYAGGAYVYPGANNRGGGGGAGAVGQTGAAGGNGGNGVTTSISGTSIAYGGGGGGGSVAVGSNTSGGTGGGGNGGSGENSPAATAGTVNRGGGGGGGASQSVGYSGAAGGSGIVIIRYTIA